MNEQQQIQWQAFLDRELPEDEQNRLVELLDNDAEAKALVDELAQIRTALKGNEPACALPVTGDFYWTQIESRLVRDAQPTVSRSPVTRKQIWLRWWIPLGVSCALLLFSLRLYIDQPPQRIVADEIESQLTDASFYSYRSQSDGISVVWVDTKAGQAISSMPSDADYMMQ